MASGDDWAWGHRGVAAGRVFGAVGQTTVTHRPDLKRDALNENAHSSGRPCRIPRHRWQLSRDIVSISPFR